MALGNTRVIPENWVEHHRPVANGQMLDQVNLWSGPLGKGSRWVPPEREILFPFIVRRAVQQMSNGGRRALSKMFEKNSRTLL